MTHQQNKQFNTYKEGLDLEFLREYCMEHGERRVMERGETLEEAGEPAQWVAFVARMLQIRDARLLATARLAPERIKGNVFDGRKHPLKHLFKSTYMTFAISSLFKNLNIV